MKDNLLTFIYGVIGGLIGIDIWNIMLDAIGTIILAFFAGIAGYLGKLAVDYFKNLKKRKKATNEKS